MTHTQLLSRVKTIACYAEQAMEKGEKAARLAADLKKIIEEDERQRMFQSTLPRGERRGYALKIDVSFR